MVDNISIGDVAFGHPGQDSRTHLGIARLVCEKVMNWATPKMGGLVGSSWESGIFEHVIWLQQGDFPCKIEGISPETSAIILGAHNLCEVVITWPFPCHEFCLLSESS